MIPLFVSTKLQTSLGRICSSRKSSGELLHSGWIAITLQPPEFSGHFSDSSSNPSLASVVLIFAKMIFHIWNLSIPQNESREKCPVQVNTPKISLEILNIVTKITILGYGWNTSPTSKICKKIPLFKECFENPPYLHFWGSRTGRSSGKSASSRSTIWLSLYLWNYNF